MRSHPGLPLAVGVLIVAISSQADIVEIEQPAPDSLTSISVRVGGISTCPTPGNPRVTVAGKDVAISLTRRGVTGGCILPAPPPLYVWEEHARIGTLPAGVYDLHVTIDGDPFGQQALVVTEANQPFHIYPHAASIGKASTAVQIEFPVANPLTNCEGPACRATEVRFGGDPATSVHVVGPRWIFATSPQRDVPGPVDVTIQQGAESITVRDAFHYYDPQQPPDRALFARVLLPVTYNGPGQFGSQWRTDAFAVAGPFLPVPLFGTATPISVSPVSVGTALLNDDRGVFVYPLRQLADTVQFSAMVRELSRDSGAVGAQLPVVRDSDFRTRDIEFASVPIEPRLRVTLRIYVLDAPGATCTVSLRAVDEESSVRATTTATRDSDGRPAFATFTDLASRLPRGTVMAGRQYHVRVGAIALEGPVRFWAFITATDNASQQVMVLTPQ